MTGSPALKTMNKVILAYSGGLYSSLILHWLKNKKGYEVVAFMAKLDLVERGSNLEEKAMELGASEVVVVDILDDFVKDYVFPTLKSNAKYESRYMFSTALSRPLIIREMLKEAFNLDCDSLAHGCSPSSNDSIRFETIVASLSSDIEIISPWPKWGISTFEDIKRYTKRYNLKLDALVEPDLIDENIWGRSIKPKRVVLDAWTEPPDEIFALTTNPLKAPNEPNEIELEFKQGLPTHLNGKVLGGTDLIDHLNKIGGKHGIGRIVGMENMLTGMKSRELYEAPAATILYTAHQALEELTLAKDLLSFKEIASRHYAKLIYQGLWFGELRESLDAFFNQTQISVSGKVRIRLYKGNCIVLGSDSPHSLFRRRISRGKYPQRAFLPAMEFTQIPILLQEPLGAESSYTDEG